MRRARKLISGIIPNMVAANVKEKVLICVSLFIFVTFFIITNQFLSLSVACGVVIRVKWSLFMCQFHYAYLVFFSIFLWFYICFRVILERNKRNGRKPCENEQNRHFYHKANIFKARSWRCGSRFWETRPEFPILVQNEVGN